MTLTTALKLHLLAPAVPMLSILLTANVFAQEAPDNSASEPIESEVNLKDVVKFNWGFQGALQGAGTPNQAGIGGFLPLSVGENSVWFLDALANVNFADRAGKSSIINTDVDGGTISTSTRLGYRWLNGDRSWMYGLNAGYDSRPMATGEDESKVPLFGTDKTAFFQQVAVNAEAVSNNWNFNAYALIPVGDTERELNWLYQGGALYTYGLDVGYFITSELDASVGYYYQSGDLGEADSSGVLGRLAYAISNGFTAGVNVSYDEGFDTRVSADIQFRFGGPSKTQNTKTASKLPVINALTSSPANRDVRVHDGEYDAAMVGVTQASSGLAQHLFSHPPCDYSKSAEENPNECTTKVTRANGTWYWVQGYYRQLLGDREGNPNAIAEEDWMNEYFPDYL